MPRHRQRTSLQDGLKLDLNELTRRGLVSSGMKTGATVVRWISSRTSEGIAGCLSADLERESDGWLRIQIGALDQHISLSAFPRYYGGRQWFFVCPVTNRRASVLWLPPGARHFASRHAWPGQVAYKSQFLTPTDRADLGKERIKQRLIGELDPEEWDLPPKPKWMRWRTYQRFVERFERYEAALDAGSLLRAMKLMKRS
jgi:hypothetical protein